MLNEIQNYIHHLKSGMHLIVKYNKPQDDFCGGWWLEELWTYDEIRNNFRCYYPVSSYQSGFFTEFDEEEFTSELKMSLHNYHGHYEIQTITDIILEDGLTSIQTKSIQEKAIEKIKTMSDKELINLLHL